MFRIHFKNETKICFTPYFHTTSENGGRVDLFVIQLLNIN